MPVRLHAGRPAPSRRSGGSTSVRVPAGTDVARFAVTGRVRGIDLYVYRDGRLVDSATGPSEGATVTLTRPPAGDYRVLVAAAAGAGHSDESGVLETWVVPQRGGSAVRLSTDAVGFAPGRRFRYSASWKHLQPGKHYLGVVSYGDSGRHTLVEVNRR